jgi:FKBP-type peptidyl-prolyl cis-trans isomerase
MNSLTPTQRIAITVTLVVIAIFFIFGNPLNLFSPRSTGLEDYQINQFEAGQPVNESFMAPQDVVIQDVAVGEGQEAQPGRIVTVHYTGKFINGQVFDSSVSRGQPFSFTLGEGRVIEGWERGLVGMKVGGKRILTIPPQYGYGPDDYGPIPGNSTLIFEVQLLGVE